MEILKGLETKTLKRMLNDIKDNLTLAFIRLANRLHKLGMEEEEIKEHLQDIYQAVADEYGD